MSRKKHSQKLPQSFILEPILTPSGLFDNGDHDSEALVVEINSLSLADAHLGATDIGHPSTVDGSHDFLSERASEPADLSFIPDYPVESSTHNTELESLPFIYSLDSAESHDAHNTIPTGEVNLASRDTGANILDFTPLTDPQLSGPDPTFDSGVFTVGATGQVSVDYLFDGGGYKGELAIFSLDGMDQFESGSDEFITEAAHRALSDSELGHIVIHDQTEGALFSGNLAGERDFNAGQYLGARTVAMRPLFSMTTANPNQAFHVGQIADVTGNGHTFAMEDLRTDGWSDRDYNDLIFQVQGATGHAIHLDEVIDPSHDWRGTELGQELLAYAASHVNYAPEITHPVADLTLTAEHSTHSIDLSQVFTDLEGEKLRYEIVDRGGEHLSLTLEGTQLYLSAQLETGISTVAIQATDEAGNSVIHSFSVTTHHLNGESIQVINETLTGLHQAINQSADITTGLDSPEGEQALTGLETLVEQNPEIAQLITQPETLSQMGISEAGVQVVQQLLQSLEFADQLGLSVTLEAALSHPDQNLLDSYQIDADYALQLLPDHAKQPKVGFLDAGDHAQHVTAAFAQINPLADYDTLQVSHGNWTQQLIKFVDQLKASGEHHGIVNLSFDLSQLDDVGYTTRYELTPLEQQAIQYAQENNILIVASAGNTGGQMSALGAASQQYDNIITVGATNQWEERADYSAHGQGLSLMAPGGEWHHNPKAFVGTSKSTAYVTAAASLVWAANPGLSYQQVKQLLLDTAVDLDAEGWDAETGAGLLNVNEAIRRAQLMEPEVSPSQTPITLSPFSGEGRVKTLERPASETTQAALTQLENTQQTLIDQWDVLSLLGNPSLTLSELITEIKQKTATAFDTYQQASTQSEVTTAQAQQWAEALALATSHYQIEQTRLQTLLERKQELLAQLTGLGQQKTALEAETQQLLADIQVQITNAESDLAKAKAKLINPFADADHSLQTAPEPWEQAATAQLQLSQTYQSQALALAAEAQRYTAIAQGHEANSWGQQVVGHQSGRSGRSKPILGWGQNFQQLKQRDQNQWQAQIAEQNRQAVANLGIQTQQQSAVLSQYAQFLEERNNSLDLGDGNFDDAAKVLQFLQQLTEKQEALTQNYWQEVAFAEARRKSNQDQADWHSSQIRTREVVGTKLKRSGKSEDVWGWVYHPEHIPPRDQAQQQANLALQERQAYEQLARQAQQQVDALKRQAEKVQTRLRDWSVFKQGIEYEITADQLRLQAQQDLLALHTPVQQQKLETLNLQISQTEAELERLQNEQLPTQTALKDTTEERLNTTQSQLSAIQEERTTALHNLQNFLDTAGFLLPYKERLAAIDQQIQQLLTDKLDVLSTIQQLDTQLSQTPSDTLYQQSHNWNGYLDILEQQLQYAQLQKDQLSLAVADSPERLAITALIRELEQQKGTAVEANGLPIQQYIDFLRKVEGSGANFLEGFDHLSERLTQAQTAQTQAVQSLNRLQQEYRNLGLGKADLENNQIPAKQQQIATKEQEITTTQDEISQSQNSLITLQTQLSATQTAQTQKQAEIRQQETIIATTQSQLSELQNQIAAKDAQIQQQQSVLQDYQNQINQVNAAVNSLEQQRQVHQNAANYWNSQIYIFNLDTYLAYNPDVAAAVGSNRWAAYYWHYLWHGQYEGRLPNPQAAVNRNAAQAAANNAAQQRDAATVNAQQLSATLQPQIAATQQQIANLEQEKQLFIQQQQALQIQLSQQQQQLQQLQQQLQTITWEVNSLQAQIQQTEQLLNELNGQLLTQQQQRDHLVSELNALNQQKISLEQQLIDKYREIELTDEYLQQVNGEITRLQSRLDLLNQVGILEQEYQDEWQVWQQAMQDQATTTEALLTTRQASAPDRQQLVSLQAQLLAVQANLEKAQALTTSIAEIRRNLELTNLQLGNQQLQLQSLIEREPSLASSEAYYYNQAQLHQQKIWYWNGRAWTYNASEAAQARSYLEQASFIADLRNKLWQQRQQTEKRINELQQLIFEQQSEIAQKNAELSAGGSIPQLEAQVATLQAAVDTITNRLAPLQNQENHLSQTFQSAVTTAQNVATQLMQTTQQQALAAQQLISFGVLASESDVDFFATQVQPQVENLLTQLEQRNEGLTIQVEHLTQLIAKGEQELSSTTDEVSQQALTSLINQSQAQKAQLESWKTENQTTAEELEKQLNQAIASLTPLRQKQELEIRQKLESNQTRLQALESQLSSEEAADKFAKTGTVLAAAELTDQVNQDLRNGVITWTQQLQDGYQKTKQLGETQKQLSASVDDLISEIQNNFADPHGEYNRSETELRDGITTLGVVEQRADEYDLSVTSTEQAIETIQLRIAQDAALWQEIAPIAIRYGVESQELQAYQQQYQAVVTANAAKLAEAEALRLQAASLNGQIKTASDSYQSLTAQAAKLQQQLNSYPHWLRLYYARSLQPRIDKLKEEAKVANQRYQSLSQQAANLRLQADAIQKQAEQQTDAGVKSLRKTFIDSHPTNGIAIDWLQGETLEGSTPNQHISNLLNATQADVLLQADAVEGRSPNQQLLDKAKAAQAEHEAQGYAALAQADWYEREAAAAWNRSRKNGPTWQEQRCRRGRSGKKRCEWITHVDHDWILWDNYRKLVPQLRQQGLTHLAEADKWRKEKERLEPLAKQWTEANEAANQAESPITDARNFVTQLTAARESIPNDQIQLKLLEDLLPTLKQQLDVAQKEAQAANAKVQQEWTEYDSDAQEYREAIEDVLQRRGELNRQAIEAQAQLSENERWVERQSVALGTELEQVKVLQSQLSSSRQNIDNQILDLVQQDVTVEGLDDLYTQAAQLEQSLEWVTNKAAVLTAQQTALTQKRTLLTAQNEVILAEQRLLDAYIKDPDADTSNLQQQLLDARAALAEAQRLAEQAAAASQALTAPLQQLKTDLLAENDEHLQAARAHQAVLKALVEKTQLNANYTLQAAQKQREVNDLEFQILTRLQQATAAGYQEAKYLLDVAHHNGIATAAEIFFRDYRDLASDKGGGCTKGMARPEDRILANQYYGQMLEQRELQRRAQQQADHFRQVKETAQAQIQTLQAQQVIAAQLLNDLNNQIVTTQEQMTAKQQELAIAQARLDGITRIREQTEQTFIQLVTLEKLNLAQAQLEQEIAQQRQAEIDQAVQNRMERDRLELERQRLETTAKIEQLRSLQAEDQLRQVLSGVRGQLGMTTLEATEDSVQLQSQLAGLLTSLKDLENQDPELSAEVKALLAEVRGDIHLALQGKEASTIQQNLLEAMGGLIGQIQQYKAEINRIDLEEQWDSQLMQTAQQDLQAASQDLLKELQRSGVLQAEQEVINPLYMEALTQVAYAQQAVEITNELGQQAKEALEQIIKQRIQQRKARKKAFWQKVLGIISSVIGILGTILSFTPLAPLGIALTAASAGINAIQSIINGDWLGGIFQAVMAGVGAVTGGMSHVLGETAKAVQVMKTLQTVASGAFSGVRSLMSGDSIMGFLQILGSVASAASAGMASFINQCSKDLQKVMLSVVQSLQQAPQLIYSGIKSIQNGDWLNAIGNIFNAALSIGQSFAGNFNTALSEVLQRVNQVGNTALTLAGAIKDGGIESWLSGIVSILNIWKDDLKGLVDKIKDRDKWTLTQEVDINQQNSLTEEVDETLQGELEKQLGLRINSAKFVRTTTKNTIVVITENGKTYQYERLLETEDGAIFYRKITMQDAWEEGMLAGDSQNAAVGRDKTGIPQTIIVGKEVVLKGEAIKSIDYKSLYNAYRQFVITSPSEPPDTTWKLTARQMLAQYDWFLKLAAEYHGIDGRAIAEVFVYLMAIYVGLMFPLFLPRKCVKLPVLLPKLYPT